MINDTIPKFLMEIDYIELREQKAKLINLKEWIEGKGETDYLDGIIHLIDAIQDHAVDQVGLKEEDVFRLTCDCDVPELPVGFLRIPAGEVKCVKCNKFTTP
jgi:hypothetical protein